MCGIHGLYRFDGQRVEPPMLSAMGNRTIHRGPDDEGQYIDGPCGIAMRRLSIIDPLAEPSNKDAAFVWSAYDAVYARLSARDMTYWKNGGKDEQLIPNEVFLDIVRIVASDLAPIFGASMEAEMDENGSMLAPGVLGMKNLRRIIGRSATEWAVRASVPVSERGAFTTTGAQ